LFFGFLAGICRNFTTREMYGLIPTGLGAAAETSISSTIGHRAVGAVISLIAGAALDDQFTGSVQRKTYQQRILETNQTGF